MDKHSTANKATYVLGIMVLGALLFFSIRFWKERTLMTDMAYHTFVIAQTGDFAIQNHRFGAAITQAFPLVAFKLGLPLKTAMQLYSSSFYIWYLVVFAIVVWGLKNWRMGIVLLSFLTLLVSYSFFWAQSEYPQGMVFLILFLSALLYPAGSAAWKFILLPVLLVTTVFCHPLIILSLIFGVSYFFLNKEIALPKFIAILSLAVLVLICKSLFLKTGNYEAGKMGGVKNFITLFPHYFTTKSWVFFFRQLVGDYAGYFWVTLLVAGYYLKNRFYVKLVWVVGFSIAYLLLVNVSFPDLEKNTYLQNLHLPLGFMIALPLVYEILPKAKLQLWVAAIVLLFAFRLGMIWQSHTFYTGRIAAIENLLEKSKAQPTNKFWVEDNVLKPEIFGETWAFSYETLLLSSIPSPDSTRTIEVQSVVEQYAFLLESDFVFINRYHGWDGNTLPPRYFNLKHSKYQKLQL
ncbi:MAG: hypothetical protein KIS94_02630 [Chitinophagales bacterium]|nr:hypothetical protein [Chitinophagales bacterium]